MTDALKVLEGIATVVIAVYVASVGTFQWFTARDKLRLDLYDRRFDVYLRAVDFMQALMMWSSVPDEERLPKRIAFIRASRESQFLFADDLRIFHLLEEFNTRSFKVTGYVEELSKYVAIMPKETLAAYDEKQSSLEWIMASISELEILMTPYLAFGHHSRIRKPKRPKP
jgi:hypothetical protein